MMRWVAYVAAGLVALAAVCAVAAFLLMDRFDLGPFAAGRAAAALGRGVTIGSLHVTPGRWLLVELRGGRLDNLPGGTNPAMAEVSAVTAEIEAMSLLHGPPVVRRLVVDGLQVLLERTADGTRNWQFGPAGPKAADGGRSGFPELLDATVNGEIVFRTTGGKALRTRLDRMQVLTDGAAAPVTLKGAGRYNDVPVSIEAELGSIAQLRDDDVPYPTDLRVASGETTVRFTGTMTDPLNFDGLRGTLDLVAPTPEAIYGIAGFTSTIQPSLRLTGPFVHEGPLWQLSAAKGALDDAVITAADLKLSEGEHGAADDVGVALVFETLDLDTLLGGTAKGKKGDADLSLAVDQAPDTLVEATLSAKALTYAGLRLANVMFKGALTPGRVAVEVLSVGYLGAQIKASGRVEAVKGGAAGQVSAEMDVTALDVQAFRRALELGSVPLQGRMDGRVALTASGATLNAAARGAHISAVVAMNGGSIAQELIELASVDARSLFRKARGLSTVSCLVGVVDMRGGVGTVSPLRVRAETGTIAGSGTFDIYRRRMDLTIGSESRTTSFFALDVPVRISGPFADPSIRPAQWSATGRAQLAASDDASRLLPGLQPFARRSSCFGRR